MVLLQRISSNFYVHKNDHWPHWPPSKHYPKGTIYPQQKFAVVSTELKRHSIRPYSGGSLECDERKKTIKKPSERFELSTPGLQDQCSNP